MAPPGRHLTVAGARLRLNTDPPRHSCRPSIDVLFESLAVERGAQVLACLLTGMGRDGAAGLLAIRRAGGFTLAQDESTSVVYRHAARSHRAGRRASGAALGSDRPRRLSNFSATAQRRMA